MIPFNKPYITGNEINYISDVINSGVLSANAKYTKLCQNFFEKKYHIKKCFLTSSCTAALEMAAILLNIKNGDEVIMPSYTFVSTANAFVLRGAKIIFADSKSENPCISEDLELLITNKTKAIVVVHYGGIACDMDKIMELALKHNLFVVEDAAQSIDGFYKGKDGRKKALGTIGHIGAISFHDTKNITSGEGGMLMVNSDQFIKRSEIIWEKGTNRSAFFRHEVEKYGWEDIGSSFSPSEMIAAFLFAQLENLEPIQKRRIEIWNLYKEKLSNLQLDHKIELPVIPDYATNNGHMFYIICSSLKERTELICYLKNKTVSCSFHYLSLHKSLYYKDLYSGDELTQADKYSERLMRLPFFYELTDDQIKEVTSTIASFYSDKILNQLKS